MPISPVIFLPEDLAAVLTQSPLLSRSYLVGGCVRDAILDKAVTDYDIEVFGTDYQSLADALRPWGRISLVGRSFGVVKLLTATGATYDFAVARRDSKVAPGHKGFEIDFDPDISLEEAASRRDYTINSLIYDPREKQVIDFFGGVDDLRGRVLRHTSAAFQEDPLRVLRGMQFAARFQLRAAPETLRLCQDIKSGYAELAVERVREEWFKWASQSVKPSLGLEFLRDSQWIEHYPEVHSLIGVPQDPEWHPEGDVFVHTCHCCDAMAALPEWRTASFHQRITLMLGILAHDFGKVETTQQVERDGRTRIISPGHDEAGAPLAESFLARIGAPKELHERVRPFVLNHMSHLQAQTDRAVRRLAKRLEPENIESLAVIITADSMGRPPLPAERPKSVTELLQRAAALRVEKKAAKPILMGRHLIEIGLTPGTLFGRILSEAYEAQMEGEIGSLEEAFAWLAEQEPFELAPEIKAELRRRKGGAT